MIRARDVMTTPVVTVAPETPFKEVVARLVEHSISGLPVVDPSGRLLGVVTEADLVSKEAFAGYRPRFLGVVSGVLSGDQRWTHKAEGLTAADFMTRDPIVATPSEELGRLGRRMLEHGIKRLPVVDGDRLVGIVTRQDLLRLFDRPDPVIAEDIRARLASPRYAPDDHQVTFTVTQGVVTLRGSVAYEGDVPVVEGLARAVPGVVAVESDVTFREPDPTLR